MSCNWNSIQGLVESEAANCGISNRPITISDACIIEIGNRFFLIALINFSNTETIIVIRISREQALDLIRNGVRNCPVFNTLPVDIQRRNLDLVGIFVVDDQAFLVFEVERAHDRFERIFVVRFPLTPIINRQF